MDNVEKLKIIKNNYNSPYEELKNILDECIKNLNFNIETQKYKKEMNIINSEWRNIFNIIRCQKIVDTSDFIAIKNDDNTYKVIKSLYNDCGIIINADQYKELILGAKYPIIIPKFLLDKKCKGILR